MPHQHTLTRGGAFGDTYTQIDAGRRTIVLRDCYEYWNANDRHADAAKPLVVDTRDGSVVQVFFDDHVEEDSAHIVDVRDAHTGTAMVGGWCHAGVAGELTHGCLCWLLRCGR